MLLDVYLVRSYYKQLAEDLEICGVLLWGVDVEALAVVGLWEVEVEVGAYVW